ncbi:type II toxin-antitoxin system HicA family toxin [Actinopolymorpha sp. NPDC004070]|uniref:type II toxin-antitoxin system HicA family toxin n=1 Tax=Actinopolymorpha sp. NPDC004070 TaxID=3154548 RepID=UPI0033B56FD6
MPKGMKLRDLERAMRKQDCEIVPSRGPHTKWVCPCGRHTANIPRHIEVSPGVVGDTIKRMTCLPEGWLQ